MSKVISVKAKQYEDYDDSLQAAADEVAERLGLQGWDLDARWADDDRDSILLTVPDYVA